MLHRAYLHYSLLRDGLEQVDERAVAALHGEFKGDEPLVVAARGGRVGVGAVGEKDLNSLA